jgi:hypothetical protein
MSTAPRVHQALPAAPLFAATALLATLGACGDGGTGMAPTSGAAGAAGTQLAALTRDDLDPARFADRFELTGR